MGKAANARKALSALLVGLLALSLGSSLAFAQAVAQGAAEGGDARLQAIEEWALRLNEAISAANMIEEQERQRLQAEVQQALQLAASGDLNGSFSLMLNVYRELTARVNEWARERIRAIIEEKVGVLEKVRSALPPEVGDLIANATKAAQGIQKGKPDVGEVAKCVKILSIVKGEVEKSNKLGWELVRQIVSGSDEETAEVLRNISGTYIATGLVAQLFPAERMVEMAKSRAQGLPGGENLTAVAASLEESIALIKQAVERFGKGDWSGFNQTIAQAREKLEEARHALESFWKAGARRGAAMGAYNMLATAEKLVEATLARLERVLGVAQTDNRAMVRGVVLQYDESARELTVLGSLHLVTISPAGKLRSAGFAPVVGSWVVKLTDDTRVVGTLREGALILAVGKATVEDGKVVVVAQQVFAEAYKEIAEISSSVEESATTSAPPA